MSTLPISMVSIRNHSRKKWRAVRWLVFVATFSLGALGVFQASHNGISNDPIQQEGSNFFTNSRSGHRKILHIKDDAISEMNAKGDVVSRVIHRHLLMTTVGPDETTAAAADDSALYPENIFSDYAMTHQGAILLFVLGVLYMFLALAIVCDEFFVPSLEVIIDKAQISEDVAGATFMAAGGSAPELFTSIIGTFIAFSDVGIGTIVGSAVFNILFVIAACAIASKTVLALTWWPLFRDVSFYSISLIFLIVFFQDSSIEWYESLVLLCCYFSYVIFMKFNVPIETAVKSCIARNRVQTVKSTDNLVDGEAPPVQSRAETPDEYKRSQTPKPRDRSCSLPMLKGSSRFRHGVLQLMIHTIDPLAEAQCSPSDPLGDGKVHEKALKLHAIASLNVISTPSNENHNDVNQMNQNDMKNGTISNGQAPVGANGNATNGNTTIDGIPARSASANTDGSTVGSDQDCITTRDVVVSNEDMADDSSQGAGSKTELDGPEEETEPLDLSWPKTWRKRITYLVVAPIVFPLWITLPDVRRETKAKWFPITFIGSIVWIAAYSYLMNWWASEIGFAIGIPDAVMGLTFLAAGTSIPDLITSVIVAKKGFGDMAVSSSIGSNIFDVTVGLPFPWILWSALNGGEPMSVSSEGLGCSVILLFIMLLAVISMIAAFKWQMTKLMGLGMLIGYAIFLTLALLLEYEVLKCFL